MAHPLQTSLLDENSTPDLRTLYGTRASSSTHLDAAVHRIRLTGMTLQVRELAGLRRVRLVLSELDVLVFQAEASSLAVNPTRRGQLAFLISALERGTLHIRLAPLAGWSPDFSIFFQDDEESEAPAHPTTLLLGPHRFERPYPHPGPAFGVLLTGPPAHHAARRFEELWRRAHDIHTPIHRILSTALAGASPHPTPPA